MKGEVPHPSNKMENYKTEFTSVRKLKYKTKEIKQYFKQISNNTHYFTFLNLHLSLFLGGLAYGLP